MKKIIEEKMDHPLSDKEIISKLKNKSNIVLYKDLNKYRNIDQLLYPHNACVILYEVVPNNGHWVCILKTHEPTSYGLRTCIEFFDSYGKMVDTQQKFIDPSYLEISGQTDKMLTRLLLFSNARYLISYNQYPFQKLSYDIKTCGRWCVLRILNKSMNLDEFHKEVVLSSKLMGLTLDEFVALII